MRERSLGHIERFEVEGKTMHLTAAFPWMYGDAMPSILHGHLGFNGERVAAAIAQAENAQRATLEMHLRETYGWGR